MIDGWGIFCKLALRWIPLDVIDANSTLVQVMAWCRQATSHYLNQWWPRSLSPYGITRSQWATDPYGTSNSTNIYILELTQWPLGDVAVEIALRPVPHNLTNDKSTLVWTGQVMAWFHQATSHYLSQCWPRSMSPYGVTRPQWVKHIQCVAVITRSIFLKILTTDPHSSPVRARYGMSVVILISYLLSAMLSWCRMCIILLILL